MEAKTASHRSAETRHSRTVRWVINQFEAVKERVEARAGAFIDREQEAWPEEAYNRGRPVTVRKRISNWMEQAELWPSEPVRDEPAEAELLMIGDTPVTEDVYAEEEVIEVDALPVRRERRRIMPAVKSESREKSRTVRVNTIAKMLKLNGAIVVPKANEIYFDFPGRGHFQSLHLWKGSPEIQEFTPNQF